MNKYDRKRLINRYLEVILSKAPALYDPDLKDIDSYKVQVMLEISFMYGKLYEETPNSFTVEEGINSMFAFLNWISSLSQESFDKIDIDYLRNVLKNNLSLNLE